MGDCHACGLPSVHRVGSTLYCIPCITKIVSAIIYHLVITKTKTKSYVLADRHIQQFLNIAHVAPSWHIQSGLPGSEPGFLEGRFPGGTLDESQLG